VALSALEKLSSESRLARTRVQGTAFLERLRRDLGGHPLIRDIRGRGLLIGLEFHRPDHPWLFWENMGLPEFKGLNSLPFLAMKELLKAGIVTHVCAHNWNVLKVEPPLIIQTDHIERFCSCLEEALGRIMEKVA
jgi:acetylornithine/succinyldiaminopimelate/putrescine aminotransferase